MSKKLNIIDLSDNIVTPCNSPIRKINKYRPPPLISSPKNIILCNYPKEKIQIFSIDNNKSNKENSFNFNNIKYLSDNSLDLIKQKLNKKSN